MNKYILLQFYFLCFSIDAADNHKITRTSWGENWKIISRSSLKSEAIGYVINAPGNYTLSESLFPTTGCSSAIISINADNVVLDFSGHTINGSNVAGKGIVIQGKKNITVKNGQFDTFKNTIIHVAPTSGNIIIKDFTINKSGLKPDIFLESSNLILQNITIHGNSSAGNCITVMDELHNIKCKNIKISAIKDHAISFGSNCYSLVLDNIDINTIIGCYNSLIFGKSCYDITIKKIKISTLLTDAIVFSKGCYGINIEKSIITNVQGSGVLFETETHSIKMIKVTCINCYQGVTFLGSNGIVLQDCLVSKCSGLYGYKWINCQNIHVENCRCFQVNNSTASIAGFWFTNCSHINCITTQSGGHNGIQSTSFKLDNESYGCLFEKCSAIANKATSTTPLQGASGFFIEQSKGCTINNSLSQSHQGVLTSIGFYTLNASNILFNECKANQCLVLTSTTQALAAGFCSFHSSSNNWQYCESVGNKVGNTISNTGYGAAGFYLSHESQSSFFKCKSLGNGSCTLHAANAYGFYLDGNLNQPCRFIEIRECSALSNCTSATTGTTAYGFYDTTPSTTNIFIDCYASSNSDNALIRNTTNYSANLPIGGTNPSSFPKVEASIDGLLDIANKPPYYCVSIVS